MSIKKAVDKMRTASVLFLYHIMTHTEKTKADERKEREFLPPMPA